MSRFCATIVLFTGLGLAAMAAPRVAIVVPLGGSVKLDGVKLTAPRIAEEGQKLSLGADGEVRLQLLGSSKEKRLKGTDYVISRAKLEQEGKVVTRGSLSVADEIGTISRAAAGTARRGGLMLSGYVPLGLELVLPPTRTENGWIIPIATPPEQIDITPGREAVVSLLELGAPKDSALYVTVDQALDRLQLTPDMLQEGHRYEITVSRPGFKGYSRVFCVLSSEDEAAIEGTEKAMIAAADEAGDLAARLRLAAFYESVCQVDKMARTLQAVTNHPGFAALSYDNKVKIVTELNFALNSLDRPSCAYAP
jgi:hypothetical protein